MATKLYTGNSSGVNLTSAVNVPLTGSGSPIGVVSGAVAFVYLSTTNAAQISGKTIYVTVWAGGSPYYGSYYVTSSSDWGGEYNGHIFPIPISGVGSGFPLNNVTAMEISISGSGSYIFTKGTQSVEVSYAVPSVNNPPTSCYTDATALNPSAGTTLRYGGASPGTAGGISGYEIQYADSTNGGATWGAWTGLTTTQNTTYGVTAPGTSGHKRKFRVRALSSLHSDYDSAWKESTNHITVNYPVKLDTPATASFAATTANPGVGVNFNFGTVSNKNLNTVTEYEIQTRTKPDGGSWGDWGSSSSSVISPKSIAANNTSGTQLQARVRAKGTAGADYYSEWKESTNLLTTNYPTKGTPPSSFNINKTTADPNETLTLTWSGAVAGNLNAIGSYYIEYRDSTDNGATWGTWKNLATVTNTNTYGTYDTPASSSHGNVRQYRISVRGAAGASYYSDFKNSGNTVQTRTPTKITAPTTITLDSEVANPGVDVYMRFSGTKAGVLNTITKYEVQYSDSTNLESWTNWSSAGSLEVTTTSGELEVKASNTNGTYRRFRLRVQGSAGSSYYSDWKSVVQMLQTTPITKVKAPTTAYVAPTNTETNAQLFFAGADHGVYNDIASYGYQYADSADGVTYGSWSNEQSVAISDKSGDFTVSPPSTRGHIRKFRIRTRGTAGASYYSDWKELGTTLQKNTAPTEPTTLTFDKHPFLNQAVFKWSGDNPGVGNAISSYTVGYSLSDNGNTFGSETTVPGVTGKQYTLDMTDQPEGKYVRFRVMSVGAGGLSSAWSNYSPVGRKNTPPSAPTNIEVPAVIDPVNGAFEVTLTDSTDPDDNIVGYEAALKYLDGSFYGDPLIVAQSNEGAVGSLSVNASSWERNTEWILAVRAYDDLGLRSDWTDSNTSFLINPLQAIPTLIFPNGNKATYSAKPRVGIRVQHGAPNREFSIKLNFAGVERTTTGSSNAEFSKIGDAIQDNTYVLWRAGTSVAPGGHILKDVRTNDGYADLPNTSRPFQRTITVTPLSFTDNILSPNLTQVKAAHINELRGAVNTMENYYGLTQTVWSEPIVKDITNIRAIHIEEIRTAIDNIISYVNLFDPDNAVNNINPVLWTDPHLEGVVIKAQHVQELRNAVLTL